MVLRPTLLGTSEPFTGEQLRAAPLRSIPRPSRLLAPLPELKPERAQKALETLGLDTAADLLEHLPHRHEDRREASHVRDLVPGEPASVVVEVSSIRTRPAFRRRGMMLVE